MLKNTAKGFITVKGRLERYEKSRNTTLYFESITKEWAEDFKEFAKEIELDPNTCKKTIEDFSTFLNHYFDDQRKHNIFLRADYKTEKIKKVPGTHSSEPSPLYPDEIKQLMLFNTDKFEPVRYGDPETKTTIYVSPKAAHKVKHLFLLACFTGLRFSDVLRLSKGSNQNDHIVIRPTKTDKKNAKTLFIPLLKEARNILESINYDISKIKLANPSANRALTQLLKQAGINTIVKEYSYNLNGERSEQDLPNKFDVVSFHSGRDTFITNSLI
ncbi:phage integrase SAM-like domain-containing protein [Chryseolinea sp. H1M3-3]|uniref:phage integrase SAM-like domain-containing protein n=1 Tax=Chryseolinea sp. H1M3-3 TaxID=3034144 RepID=UPI0023EB4B5B|nr:phage integrase SAM-like domain-containing protein [Chryseolinea sp. H1M3-3]